MEQLEFSNATPGIAVNTPCGVMVTNILLPSHRYPADPTSQPGNLPPPSYNPGKCTFGQRSPSTCTQILQRVDFDEIPMLISHVCKSRRYGT